MSARQITVATADPHTTTTVVSPQGARMNTNTSLTGSRWALRHLASRGGTDPISRFVERGEISPDLVEVLRSHLAGHQARPFRQRNHLAEQDLRHAIDRIEAA